MTASIPCAPLVSVVMAVKNGGELMREAVDSILNQTFTDFEFIIINDGSTDNTLEILGEYQDPRIQVYSQENRGVARSANRGLALARGKYIARQDHDDISLPTRLQKQVEYLEAHPECGLLGTAAEIWDQNGDTGRRHDHPVDPSELKFDIIFNNPFVHSSILFRREIIKTVGIYDPSTLITPLDDYHFISRVSFDYPIANLSERLVIYRESYNSLTSDMRNRESKIELNKKLAFVSCLNIRHYCSNEAKNKAEKFSNVYHANGNFKLLKSEMNLFIKELKEIANELLSIQDINVVGTRAFYKLDHLTYRAYVNPGYIGFYDKYKWSCSLYFNTLSGKIENHIKYLGYKAKLRIIKFLSILKSYIK